MEEQDIIENMKKNTYFYIVDCEDFIYYARRVKIIRNGADWHVDLT